MVAPRGIRNHNPGNIKRSEDKWQGLANEQTDPHFFVFKSAQWGIRALARVLITYYDKYGLNTIESIIQRWAPPSENETSKYIDFVCRQMGEHMRTPLGMHNYVVMDPLVRAIIQYENGQMPYTEEQIQGGLLLAGVPAPDVGRGDEPVKLVPKVEPLKEDLSKPWYRSSGGVSNVLGIFFSLVLLVLGLNTDQESVELVGDIKAQVQDLWLLAIPLLANAGGLYGRAKANGKLRWK